MTPLLRTGIILAAMMFVAAVLAYVMKPTRKLVDFQPRERLEILLPMQFGDWRGQPANNLIVADPQMAANLARIYTEILSRTYVNSHGRQIMLSIAYGDDQRDGMSVHYPEICYPAQGFQVTSLREDVITTSYGPIPVKRLETLSGGRREFITYWVMTGDYPSTGGIYKKMNEMRYSLLGQIPDGLLFRVSTIDNNEMYASAIQNSFIIDIANALSADGRKRIAGL